MGMEIGDGDNSNTVDILWWDWRIYGRERDCLKERKGRKIVIHELSVKRKGVEVRGCNKYLVSK